MQTTKFLFLIGAAAILAAPLSVSAAPDTEAQAKLREALRKKIEEANPPVAPAPAPVAPPVVVAPAAPKPAPAPAVKAPTVVVPIPAEPVAAATPAVPAKAAGADPRFSELPDPDADAQAARIREALRQKIAAERAAAPATAVAPAKPGAVVWTPAPKATAAIVTPIETAPSPLSGSKQQRLAALLQLYKSDQITPQQYHTQRAAIIAEP
jgi:2-oxoglutarate dehydrogenase E2 component (dihydrolipoamide succinyltransferase)